MFLVIPGLPKTGNFPVANFFPDHFSVWVFFSSSLSREVFGVGNELFRDPWGRPKKTLVIIIVVGPSPSKGINKES